MESEMQKPQDTISVKDMIGPHYQYTTDFIGGVHRRTVNKEADGSITVTGDWVLLGDDGQPVTPPA